MPPCSKAKHAVVVLSAGAVLSAVPLFPKAADVVVAVAVVVSVLAARTGNLVVERPSDFGNALRLPGTVEPAAGDAAS